MCAQCLNMIMRTEVVMNEELLKRLTFLLDLSTKRDHDIQQIIITRTKDGWDVEANLSVPVPAENIEIKFSSKSEF